MHYDSHLFLLAVKIKWAVFIYMIFSGLYILIKENQIFKGNKITTLKNPSLQIIHYMLCDTDKESCKHFFPYFVVTFIPLENGFASQK